MNANNAASNANRNDAGSAQYGTDQLNTLFPSASGSDEPTQDQAHGIITE